MLITLLDLIVAALVAAAVNGLVIRKTGKDGLAIALAILTFIVVFLLRPITYLVTMS